MLWHNLGLTIKFIIDSETSDDISLQRYLFYITQNYSLAILRPVQKEILSRGKEIAWFVEGDHVDLDYFKNDETRLKTVKEVINYKPDAILYPANTAPTFLPGINVAVFHGFDAGKLDKRGHNDHFKIRNCFHLYCTQGPSTTTQFNLLKIKSPHFQVTETGWCALDPLFEKKPENLPIDHITNKPKILLCSTFSKNLSCAEELFETVKYLSRSNKWQWMVQFHPKMKAETVAKYRSIQNENLSYIETDDVLPLLKQADVMVCDTSSVLLMFLMLNKPVVTFNNISPQEYMININTPEALEESIELALSKPSELMEQINDFTEQTHPYDDGCSSKRLIDAIDDFSSKKKSNLSLPFDFFRQFKIRKRLNYWKFW